MSVRIGTPTFAADSGERRQPGLEARARETTVTDVRFALSNDALKTYGTPARRAMSAMARPKLDRVLVALDDARAGDEDERPPAQDHAVGDGDFAYGRTSDVAHGCQLYVRDAAEAQRRARLSPIAVTFVAMPCSRHLALVGRFDEARKQRMRTQRLRLELRMELHRQIPGMAGQLDDFDELAVERSADDAQPGVGRASSRTGS